VRPHPFEDAKLYRSRYADFPNVTVDGSGNVLNVLNAADCMVHLNCGSAVETVLLGKTPISLEYLNTGRMRSHASLPSAISCHAAGERDLDLLVKTPAERERRWSADALRQRYIEPWFHGVDGCASARTAAAIAEAIRTEAKPVRASIRSSAAGGVAAPSRGQLAQGVASQLLGSRVVAALRSSVNRARSHKAIAAPEVSRLLTRLREHDGSRARLRVEPARHPLTGARLASLLVTGDGAA
jgi:hypothetical protein